MDEKHFVEFELLVFSFVKSLDFVEIYKLLYEYKLFYSKNTGKLVIISMNDILKIIKLLEGNFIFNSKFASFYEFKNKKGYEGIYLLEKTLNKLLKFEKYEFIYDILLENNVFFDKNNFSLIEKILLQNINFRLKFKSLTLFKLINGTNRFNIEKTKK